MGPPGQGFTAPSDLNAQPNNAGAAEFKLRPHGSARARMPPVAWARVAASATSSIRLMPEDDGVFRVFQRASGIPTGLVHQHVKFVAFCWSLGFFISSSFWPMDARMCASLSL